MPQKNLDSTFLTKPVKWNDGLRRGFIVYPHDENGDSWGQPYRDEEGNLIVPGTIDGKYPDAFLGVKDGKWRSFRNEKYQAAGNIDWKGPWINDDATKRRIVTVNGPSGRYWNTGAFVYDGSDKNHYVYYGGRVCAITPKPVLGACWVEHETTVDSLAGPVPVTEEWVLAVCKDGFEDVVYGRPALTYVQEDDITQDDFTKYKRLESQLQQQSETEAGWIEFGRWGGFVDEFASVAPEAPWFFNDEGSMTRTMRRCSFSHTNQANGEPMDDTLYREASFTLDIGSRSAVFASPDGTISTTTTNNKWDTFMQQKRRRAEYIQPANESSDGDTHRFDSDNIRCDYFVIGQSKVAVDYDPDKGLWVYGWIKGKLSRIYANDWSLCTDDGVTYGSVTNRAGATSGPLPPPNFPSVSFDDEPDDWVGHGDVLTFNINPYSTLAQPQYAEIAIGWGRTGTSSVMNGGEPDPENTALAFIDSFDTWIQYVDLRSGMIVGEVLYNFMDYFGGFGGNSPVWEETLLWTTVGDDPVAFGLDPFGNSGDPGGPPFDVPDTPLETDPDAHIFMRYPSKPPRLEFFFPGWTKSEMVDDEWPDEDANLDEQLTGYNFSAKMTTENSEGEYWPPYWQDGIPPFMAADTRPGWLRITIPEILTTPGKCDSTGIFGTTELGESLVYLEYFNLTEKRDVAEAFSRNVDGDAVEALEGGSRMYPGGLL